MEATSFNNYVIAHYSGLVELVGDLVANPGVSGADRAGLSLVFVPPGVPEENLEEDELQVDVPGSLG